MTVQFTAAEAAAMEHLSGFMQTMARDVVGRGPTRDSDLAEIRDKVHQLQALVLAQVAARNMDGIRQLGQEFATKPAGDINLDWLNLADPPPQPPEVWTQLAVVRWVAATAVSDKAGELAERMTQWDRDGLVPWTSADELRYLLAPYGAKCDCPLDPDQAALAEFCPIHGEAAAERLERMGAAPLFATYTEDDFR